MQQTKLANCHFQSIMFSALHGMPARTSDDKGVRLSVKHVDCDKTEKRSVQILTPY